MKNLGLFLITLLAVNSPLWADGDHSGMDRGQAGDRGDQAQSDHPAFHADQAPASRPSSYTVGVSRPAPSRHFNPVHIDLSHPGSGANNRNFQRPAPQSNSQPVYGQVQWKAQTSHPSPATTNQTHVYAGQQQNINAFAQPGSQAAAAVHHHPYTQGYVRKKLQTIGVTKAPGYIMDRQEIINTDRGHSIIHPPLTGPQGGILRAVAVSPRHYSDPIVKTQMKLVVQASMRQRVQQYNQLESAHGHYYWHRDNGFNYCHYVDDWGYHWYGWYVGNSYFWTRNYANRWWWYDTDYDRWCFWNAGFWWWQDPAHVGDLYCYNNASYIPCNSAEDQIVVTVNSPSNNGLVFTSPDGTRKVKVMGDSKDAFLYDTANPPSFAPVYLASEVSNVQFSNNSGRPLEIVLSLGDGTFDLFDAQGNPYGPGSYDADQSGDSTQYSDGSTAQSPPAPPMN
jgi:hypothetical protein